MCVDERDKALDPRRISLAGRRANSQSEERLRLRDQLGMRGSAGVIGEGSMLLRQRIES